MKRNGCSRLCLSAMLALLLCVGLLPASAGAEDTAPSDEAVQEVMRPGQTRSVSVEEGEFPDSEELLMGYLDDAFAMEKPETSLGSIVDKLNSALFVGLNLTDNQRAVYNILKEKIEQVAAGELSSTVFTITPEQLGLPSRLTASVLGLDYVYKNGRWNPDMWKAADAVVDAAFSTSTDLGPVNQALLLDCPYELYWYDKTYSDEEREMGAINATPPGYSATSSNGGAVTFSSGFVFELKVANAYAEVASTYWDEELQQTVTVYEDFIVDTSTGQKVQNAVTKAVSIRNDHAGETDLEKLTGYKNDICTEVSYNHDAADNDNTPYGDPWQLIYVFDQDLNTNVVCEGYSKAFQYLCELTDFDSDDINCYSVSGTMAGGTGGGAHMWNVVHMDDGQNYLVDVTNCDSGTIGYPDKLFLKGARENTASTDYTVSNVRYVYDSDIRQRFTADQRKLSTSNYTVQSHTGLEGANHTLSKVEAVPASCDAAGNSEYYVCDACGKIFPTAQGKPAEELSLADVTIPATGHSMAYVEAVPRTCEEDGTEAYWICSSCGKMFADEAWTNEISEPVAIPAYGHSWDNGEVIVAPGKTTEGLMKYTCRRDISHTKTEVIPATGEAAIVESGYCGGEGDGTNLSWTLDEDGLMKISGTGMMADYASEFYTPWHESIEDIQEVMLETGVSSIGDNAFCRARSLEHVTIPLGVISVGASAFNECVLLEEIVLPSSVDTLGSLAFGNCTALTGMEIPEDVTEIPASLFVGDTSLTSVTLPEGITAIGNYAFSSTSALERVTLPSTVRTIGTKAFGSSGLTSIEIPSGVQTLEKELFDSCGSLTSVIIPNTVTSIGESAFRYCTSLNELVIPSSVTMIGKSAFRYDTGLKDVYYEGPESDWNAVAIHGTGNDPLKNANIHCLRTVTFDPAGGTVEPASLTIYDGKPLGELPTPVYGDNTFNGWYTEAEGGEAVTENTLVPGDVTYYAQWAHDHVLTETAEVPATCEEPGVAAYWTCETCGKLFSDSEGTNEISEPTQIPAKSHAWNEGVVTTPADCETPGVKTYTCANDPSHTRTEEILPTGHEWDEGVVTTPATGTTDGVKTYTCRHDSSHTRTEVIPATGEDAGLKIITQPQDMPVVAGDTASTTVVASGEGLTYQWYLKNSNQSQFFKSAVKDATYSVTATKKMDGRQVYCEITDAEGNSVTSDVVTLSVERADVELVITVQPQDVTVGVGETAVITVEAQSVVPMAYQWYTRNSNQNRFYKSSVTSDTYTVTTTAKMDGRQLYCVITDANNETITSNTVTLTVQKSDVELVINTQPQDVTVSAGEVATFTVEAQGVEPLKYQWYTKNSNQTRFYKSSVTSDTYSVTATEKMSGRQLYCVVTDAEGNIVTTNEVTLTVEKSNP